MSASVASAEVATEGAEVSGSFHRGDKDVAVRVWREVVDRSGLDDKVLAIDAGISRGYYSKVATGEQGCLISLVFRVGQKHPTLKREFFARLAEIEGADPEDLAGEQLAAAALRFLKLRALKASPRPRVAKVGLR